MGFWRSSRSWSCASCARGSAKPASNASRSTRSATSSLNPRVSPRFSPRRSPRRSPKRSPRRSLRRTRVLRVPCRRPKRLRNDGDGSVEGYRTARGQNQHRVKLMRGAAASNCTAMASPTTSSLMMGSINTRLNGAGRVAGLDGLDAAHGCPESRTPTAARTQRRPRRLRRPPSPFSTLQAFIIQWSPNNRYSTNCAVAAPRGSTTPSSVPTDDTDEASSGMVLSSSLSDSSF